MTTRLSHQFVYWALSLVFSLLHTATGAVCLLSFVPCLLLAPHSYRGGLFTDLCPLFPCSTQLQERFVSWPLSLVFSLLHIATGAVCFLSFVLCLLLALHSYRGGLFPELCPLSCPCCPEPFTELCLLSHPCCPQLFTELCLLSRPCCPQLFTELCLLSHPCCPQLFTELCLLSRPCCPQLFTELCLLSRPCCPQPFTELCPLSHPCCPQLGELGEAEDALMEANILNNSDPEVWGYLSLVCLRTARKVEAEQSYKHAVKVRLVRRPAVLLVWGVKLEVEWNCCIWI